LNAERAERDLECSSGGAKIDVYRVGSVGEQTAISPRVQRRKPCWINRPWSAAFVTDTVPELDFVFSGTWELRFLTVDILGAKIDEKFLPSLE
jgi:hypothetical protein